MSSTRQHPKRSNGSSRRLPSQRIRFRHRGWATALSFFLLTAGCAPSAPPEGLPPNPDLAPVFPPLSSTPEPTPSRPLDAPPPDPETPLRTPAPPDGIPATDAPSAPTLRATITDPLGDVTPTTEPSPPYADLVGAVMTRTTESYELRIRVAGQVPERAPEGRTMNVAAFFETTGDGRVDYEVWANLGDTGWGPAWFDDDGARYMDRSGVSIMPLDDELLLSFPLEHLAGADRFRWAIASEWGRYEVISTSAAARDRAPDNGVADFPG